MKPLDVDVTEAPQDIMGKKRNLLLDEIKQLEEFVEKHTSQKKWKMVLTLYLVLSVAYIIYSFSTFALIPFCVCTVLWVVLTLFLLWKYNRDLKEWQKIKERYGELIFELYKRCIRLLDENK